MNPITKLINHIWDSIHAVLSGFYLTLHRGKVIRRSVLYIALWLQYTALEWSMAFAAMQPMEADMVGVAAIIAAVLTPVSGLLAAAIKFYNDARRNETADDIHK